MNESESTVQSAERKYGPLDPPEAHPPRSPRSRLSIVLGVLCAMLAIVCCVLWGQRRASVSAAAQLEKNNLSLMHEKAALGIENNRLKGLLTKEKEQSADYAHRLDTAKELLESLTPELAFWEGSAVLVTGSGQKYHTWNCQYVADKDYWIYNVENAIYKGYQPCRVCDPPER